MGAQLLLTNGLTLAALCVLVEPASAATLTWSAPPSCPSEAEVHEQLARELGNKLASASGVTFEAIATKQRAGFQLDLTTREGGALHERRIQAESCRELLEAMVVAVSLALQAAAEGEPPAPEEQAPTSQPALAEHAAVTPRAPATVQPPAPDESNGRRLHPLGGVGAVIDVGAFPQPGFGVHAFLGLRISDFKLIGSGAFFPEHSASLVGSARARFMLSFGGASVCYTPENSVWELGACLGGELGSLAAMGSNVKNPRATSSLWAAANAAAWFTVRPRATGWGVFLSPGVVVPFRRPPFVLTELGLVHQPASVGFRGLAGLELELR